MAQSETESDSIGYTPEWTDRTFADVDYACVQMQRHGEGAVSVGTKGDAVSIEIRQDMRNNVFSVMDADTADWLADQLQNHAEAARNNE